MCLQLAWVLSLVCIVLQGVSKGLHDMEQTATFMSDHALGLLTAAFSASVSRLDLNNQGSCHPVAHNNMYVQEF